MDIPDNIREIVDQLSAALVRALADDECTRTLAEEIQDRGFDVVLMLEVAMTLHKRDDDWDHVTNSEDPNMAKSDFISSGSSFHMSADDKAFLKTFRISAE